MRTSSSVRNRRDFLLGGLSIGAATLAAPSIASSSPRPQGSARVANFFHQRTGERFNDVYFENGVYIASALAWADWVLRDVNVDKSAIMSNQLIDLLARVSGALDNRELMITSGYRCAQTNAKTRNAASNSLHLTGRAADFRCEGVNPAVLARAARAVGAGGVGLYAGRNLVHIDVGERRDWRG